MKRTILLTVLLLSSFLSFAQETRSPHSNLNLAFGDAPNGAGGHLAENIGIDPYTGRLKAGFTLYSYQNKTTGLSHAITLDYQGDGILVDALASNTGMNWSLNTNCFIHRDIKGLPDEDPLGFLNASAEPTSFTLSDTTRLSEYIADSLDGQFDIYHFQAGGSGGQFIIGKNGQIITIPDGNTKIERLSLPWSGPSGYMDSANGNGFRITTADGTKYLFEKYDCMELDYLNGNRHASTTWYITKIIAPFERDSVIFNYAPIVIKYDAGLNILNYSASPPPPNNDPDVNPDPVFCNAASKGATIDRTMRLTDVQYPDGTQVFVGYDGFYRLDLVDDNAVNAVTVTNGTSSYNFRFRYSYMQRNNPGGYSADLAYGNYTGMPGYNPATIHQEAYSLKLLGFKRFTASGDSVAGYNFMYNDSVGLPERLSLTGTDQWGYYNGRNDDGRITKVRSIGGVTLYYGAILTPFVKYASAQALKGIELPTGGKVLFDFELNTSKTPVHNNLQNIQVYDSVGGLRVKSMRYFDPSSQSTITKTYRYVEADGATSSGVMANTPINNFLYREFVFQSFYVHVGNYIFLHQCNGGSNSPDFLAHDFLVRTSMPQNYMLYTHGSPVGYGRVEEYSGTPSNYKNKKVYKFSTANDYQIDQQLMANGYNFPFPYVPTNDYAWGLPLETTTFNANGIMLKKITNSYQMYPSDFNTNDFRGVKVGIVGYPFHTLDSSFAFKNFYPTSGKVFLTATTDSTYFVNGRVVINNTQITFDITHNVPQYTLSTNARNETIKKLYYYPFDFTVSGAIATLQSRGMIYSPVRTETWKMTAQPQLLDASVINIDQYNDIVRTSEGYDFISTQPVLAASWGAFNPNQLLPSATQYIQKVAIMDRYDSKGNPIQVTAKGTTTSMIYGQNQHYVFATAVNAKASDIAYTSFESFGDYGGWQANGNIWSNTSGYTGKYTGRLVGSNSCSFGSLDPNKSYTLSVWTSGGAPAATAGSLPSVNFTQGETHSGWTLWKATISNASSVTMNTPPSGSIYIDELRIYPIDAAMTTYTYDPLYGITSTTDLSNHTTFYQYDGFGRIKYQLDMDGNITKSYDYKEQDIQP